MTDTEETPKKRRISSKQKEQIARAKADAQAEAEYYSEEKIKEREEFVDMFGVDMPSLEFYKKQRVAEVLGPRLKGIITVSGFRRKLKINAV